MLFSHPDVARFLSDSFECAWESVRPVPHVTIDFGNGRMLERTLHGNIVTYLCTASGEVYDLIPGLVDPREYVRRLDQAVRLRRGMRFVQLIPPIADGMASRSEAPPAPVHDPSRALWTRWHEAVVARAPANEFHEGDPINVFDGSKMRTGLGASIVLTSPKGDKLRYARQIHFAASNNVTEYEALIHGLRLAKELGIRRILCYGDSDLVVQQSSGDWDAKDANMASY